MLKYIIDLIYKLNLTLEDIFGLFIFTVSISFLVYIFLY